MLQDDLAEIYTRIQAIDSKLSLYLQEVLEKAKVKKGSSLYEQGISLARSAELLGLTQWELMNYVGKTKVMDQDLPSGFSVRQRMNYAKSLFGIDHG